ncbi:histidine phosphatase superfamily [Alternaria rosae]|uniref:histidine phosphatase superfamily n=1 Tax=Alternaria rosae TaxID=1187941 RepID=UPI001E8E74CF|nr:histidine phosphatase superfamily [Alternaria rosae]KAH6860923.1 histidine phosphatase superfamily [Alternaria rosae]
MFTRTIVAAMASASLAGAQSSDSEHTLAAFAFVRTGDRTPVLRNNTQTLTTLGANQMHALGQKFRSKFVSGTESIAELSEDVLNNDQIWVQTLDAPYLVSSAQAFMQGLFPPHDISNATGDNTGVLADGTSIDYPLNGYQYASIHAANVYDPYARLVSGSAQCPQGQSDALKYFTTPEYWDAQTLADNRDLYKNLPLDWFEGHVNQDELSYLYALEIADYLSYQYSHNSSIYKTLANDSDYTGLYNELRYRADEVAWYLYGNTSATDTSERAIGGKTLAGSIQNTFDMLVSGKNNSAGEISSAGQISTPSPLTLFFGEQDAMMSLMSLMMLDTQSSDFKSIPPYGSAMIFELFSTSSSTDMPSDPNDLWVRFYFHNGTDADDKPLQSYSMFNNGRSMTDMPYTEFERLFSTISMHGLTDWCETCSTGAFFCRGADGSGVTLVVPSPQEKQKKDTVSPVVGGVIGAIVSLVVAGLLFALAMLLTGLRFHRVEHRLGGNRQKSDLGGFKGSAKLASDPDVSLAGNGAPPATNTAGIVSFGGDHKRGHERVGSWELRQKEFGKDVGGESPRSSFGGIDGVAVRGVEASDRV